MYIISLAPGLFVGKSGRSNFSPVVVETNAYRFKSKLAARLINSIHRGTIIKLNGS
jgi:hypothetical protein